MSNAKAGFFFKDPLPGRAKAYLLSVILLGLPVFLYCLYHALLHPDLNWVYLVAPTLITSYFPIRIPLGHGKRQSLSITVSDVFVFAAILLFGAEVAALLAVLEGLFSGLRVRIKRLYKQLFNLAHLALLSFLVAQVFYRLARVPAPLDSAYLQTDLSRFLIQMGLVALLYFVLNSGTVALAMSLATGQPFLEIWKGHFLWVLVGNFANAFLAAFLFRHFGEIPIYSIALVAPIVLAIYYGYKASHDRIRQAAQHVDELRELLAQTVEAEKALQKAKDELELRVEERTLELQQMNQQLLAEMSHREQLEQAVLRAQKLESLGILAGGIAHDFNNILTGILMKTQLATRAAAQGKDPRRLLAGIEDATRLATGLTHQLLTFAKGGEPLKEAASLQEILHGSATFSLRGSKTRCEFQIADDLWPVQVDKGQISQVVQNLVINGAQAMPRGGTIIISAENFELDSTRAAVDLPSGPYVMVRVQDQGTGIAPSDLTRIFDPYFSTKPEGHGLGLTTTHSIIRKHGGFITVESELAKGTTFTFYLPAVSELGDQPPASESRLMTGSGRILVVDDEEIIRECLGALLEELGYKAEFASNGAEAVSIYHNALRNGGRFDTVIMDLTMPGGMGGKETIQKLLEIDPQVRAVVSSGYSEDPVMADYQRYGFGAVLLKPFAIEEVSRVLAALLKDSRPSVLGRAVDQLT